MPSPIVQTRVCPARDCSDNDNDSGDPLVFDLNGDGEVNLVAVNEGVQFDMDNDGVKEQSGWVSADDGLLALDRNGNGTIDSQSELFGMDGKLAFDHLAEYDSNKDGQITSDDDIWGDLVIWQDSDSNGISGREEMQSLDHWEINSINLAHTDVKKDYQGNEVTGKGTFTKLVDGVVTSVGKVLEVFFSFFT